MQADIVVKFTEEIRDTQKKGPRKAQKFLRRGFRFTITRTDRERSSFPLVSSSILFRRLFREFLRFDILWSLFLHGRSFLPRYFSTTKFMLRLRRGRNASGLKWAKRQNQQKSNNKKKSGHTSREVGYHTSENLEIGVRMQSALIINQNIDN